ncbi:MAG: hypothetical protein ACLVCH_05125 [Roseburia inulinivorans]
MKLKIATDDPEKIIEELKLSKEYRSLFFLILIYKCAKNGLTLAKEIREYDPRGFIVFVTSHIRNGFFDFSI